MWELRAWAYLGGAGLMLLGAYGLLRLGDRLQRKLAARRRARRVELDLTKWIGRRTWTR